MLVTIQYIPFIDFMLFFPFFFFNDTATTEIYTLSLHDALPIFEHLRRIAELDNVRITVLPWSVGAHAAMAGADRKSTRLNSSHSQISYAVFCLKKKKTPNINITQPLYYPNRLMYKTM